MEICEERFDDCWVWHSKRKWRIFLQWLQLSNIGQKYKLSLMKWFSSVLFSLYLALSLLRCIHFRLKSNPLQHYIHTFRWILWKIPTTNDKFCVLLENSEGIGKIKSTSKGGPFFMLNDYWFHVFFMNFPCFLIPTQYLGWFKALNYVLIGYMHYKLHTTNIYPFKLHCSIVYHIHLVEKKNSTNKQ